MKSRRRIGIAFAILLGSAGLGASGCSDDGGSPNGPNGGGLELNSPSLAQNERFEHLFANIGEYPYHCSLHAAMRDTVIVQVGGPLSVEATISGFAFGPNPLIVAPGGTVTWTNHDSAPHTVTSDSPNP